MKIARFGIGSSCARSRLSLLILAALRTGSGADRRTAAPRARSAAAKSRRLRSHRHPGPAQGSLAITISVTVPVVNVDVVVTDNDGNYLSGLKKENFRITEDGAPQAISNFATGDAPITVVLLVEYSQLGYYSFLANARYWGDIFIHQLKPVDWVALESFNMRSNVDVDFTHDPR